MMKIGLATMAAMAALALSTTSALAQAPTPSPPPVSAAKAGSTTTTVTTSDYVEQRTDGSQVVTFGTDNLDGDPLSAYGFTLRRPPGVLRAQLIRPRMNFVSELLKSVENL